MSVWDFLATPQGGELVHAAILLLSALAALVSAYAAAKAQQAHTGVTLIQRQMNGKSGPDVSGKSEPDVMSSQHYVNPTRYVPPAASDTAPPSA